MAGVEKEQHMPLRAFQAVDDLGVAHRCAARRQGEHTTPFNMNTITRSPSLSALSIQESSSTIRAAVAFS